MDLFNFSPEQYFSFLLTLLRCSLLVFLLPFFGGSGIPNMVKAALCLVLSMGLWPNLSFAGSYFPANVLEVCLMVLGEILLGLVLGMVVRFIFAGIQTAGQILGFQMGFAMMNVVDPMSGVSVTLTSQFLYLASLLIFLSLNGHLFLLTGLAKSFDLVSPGMLIINPVMAKDLLGFSSQIFVLAVKVAAPVTAAVFLVDLSLGIMARVAPQVNVLFVGFPIKIAVGFMFMGVLFSLLGVFMQDYLTRVEDMFTAIMGG